MTQMETKEYWKEGIDSKEYLIRFLFKLMEFILIGVAGAVIGSGLYLLIMMIYARVPVYQSETEYYVDFVDGQLEGAHHYNDFTWNTVIGTDLILGRAMEQLPDYDRAEIKEMITADIWSDVRYLTITVQDSDAKKVEAVSTAIGAALESFAVLEEQRDTFESIFKIEDSGVIQMVKPLFTWRAAFWGFVIGFLASWFVFSVRFAVADAFYTRANIENYLRIPSLGIRFRQGKKKQQMQLELEETADGIVILIPFGVSCRRKLEDMIRDLRQQGCKITGAILTEADAKWMKLYYGTYGGKECD